MSKATEWRKQVWGDVVAAYEWQNRRGREGPAFRFSFLPRDPFTIHMTGAWPPIFVDVNAYRGEHLVIGDCKISPEAALALSAWIVEMFGESVETKQIVEMP